MRLLKLLQQIRIQLYKLSWELRPIRNDSIINQPVLFVGKGTLAIGNCSFGYWPSPSFFHGYSHIEARELRASIVIGDGVFINNCATIIAERSKIEIKDNCLIGNDFCAMDSDFHHVDPIMRKSGCHESKPITIGNNVFIGSRVTILKGVSIGDNCVIASGAIVTKSMPSDSIVGGCPAKVLKHIN